MLVRRPHERRRLTDASMALLARAHEQVGGEILSGGGTGTYAVNTVATEIQAGSYALMDTAYAKLDIPFALPPSPSCATADPRTRAGPSLIDGRALGMDYGRIY